MKPLEGLSLRSNFSWALGGSLVYSLCQWLTLAVIAKSRSPDAVGGYALGLAYSAPIFLFFESKLREVLAADARREYQFRDYLRLRLWAIGASLTVVAAIALLREGPNGSGVILAVAMIKATESLGDIATGRLQLASRMDLSARAQGLRGIVGIAVLTLVLVKTGSVGLALFAQVGAYAVAVAFLEMRWALRVDAAGGSHDLRSEKRIERHALRRLWLRSLPLAAAALLMSLRVNVPRVLLEDWRGVASLGLFAAIAAIPDAGNRVFGPLLQAAITPLAVRFGANLREFRRLLTRLSLFVSAGSVAAVVLVLALGKRMLSTVYTTEYGAHADVLLVLMIAAAITYLTAVVNTALMATRMYTVQLPLAALGAVVAIAVSMTLIPSIGMLGMAFAELCAAVLSLGGSVYVLRRITLEARPE